MLKILFRLIIYLGCHPRRQQKFLKLLAKIEHGVAIFCFKLAAIARRESRHDLADSLESHANDEKRHGKMLSSLAGDKINLTDNGQFTELYKDGVLVVSKPYSTPTIHLQGIHYSGSFENLDGLSLRYLSLRMLFKGKSAIDFPWEDRLAFMQVLEGVTQKFYAQLSQYSRVESIRAIALKIAVDEITHADYLKYVCKEFRPDILKWEAQLNWAILGLMVDVVDILKSGKNDYI